MISLSSFQSYDGDFLAQRDIKKSQRIHGTKTHEPAGLPMNRPIAPRQKPRQTLSTSGRANL